MLKNLVSAVGGSDFRGGMASRPTGNNRGGVFLAVTFDNLDMLVETTRSIHYWVGDEGGGSVALAKASD
jgi:hypothetical protein